MLFVLKMSDDIMINEQYSISKELVNKIAYSHDDLALMSYPSEYFIFDRPERIDGLSKSVHQNINLAHTSAIYLNQIKYFHFTDEDELMLDCPEGIQHIC